MKTKILMAAIAVAGSLLPEIAMAQSGGGEIQNLQSVLDSLYDEMLPLCSQLIDVGRGLAGFAAMWYIASRIWRHIANAEAVDFYPLLRPFVIGFCILIFPSVLTLVNSILKPTVTGTASMVSGANASITELLKRKEEAIKKTPYWQMYVGAEGDGDKEKWYRYSHPEGTEEGFFEGIGNDIKFAMAKASYNFRNSIKQWMSEILHVLYLAAGLCINTIRTFYLIVLAILGPLVFGLSVFDGLHHSLTIWLARYINVFLWLPVANIFGSIIGKIQENMLKIDIAQVQKYGDTFFSSSDTAYLIFMVIGIVGYFTVPSIANYIVNAGGGNVLLFKTTNLMSGGAHSVANSTMNTGRSMVNSLDLSKQSGQDHFGSKLTSTNTNPEIKKDSEGGYMHKKVSGQ
jgi:conjugative transposon TraJ protein